MCTVSVIRPLTAPSPSTPTTWFRVVANRDELRTRVAGAPPRVTDIEGLRVALPIDPGGGGTWIAASELGLVFALLNAADDGVGRPEPPSRGAIIPSLAGSETLDEAGNRLLARDWQAYRPWRLLVTDGERLITARPVGARVRLIEQPLPRAFMTTSSSYEETRAPEARARLFHRLVTRPDRDCQDAVHAHQWTEYPELSVAMSRPDARTVSRTIIEVGPGGVVMTTTATESSEGPPVTVSLASSLPRAGAA